MADEYKKHMSTLTSLEITASPVNARSVKSTACFIEGSLCLVPLTPSISMKKNTEPLSAGVVQAGSFVNPATGESYKVALHAKIELPKADTSAGHAKRPERSPFVVPAWFVRQSTHDTEVNMHWVEQKLKVNCMDVCLPVMKNMKVVNVGDELVVKKSVVDPKSKNKAMPPMPTAPPKAVQTGKREAAKGQGKAKKHARK